MGKQSLCVLKVFVVSPLKPIWCYFMRKYFNSSVVTFFLLGLIAPSCAYALRWPVLIDERIVYSENGGTAWVYYQTSGSMMVSAPERSDPGLFKTVDVVPWGIHCNEGDKPSNFNHCSWSRPSNDHSPKRIGYCETIRIGSWILTDRSTCTVSTSVFGPHNGAGPGAECVVFGKGPENESTLSTNVISTPWGDLSALQVATSGNSYCTKPAPPKTVCSVMIANDGVINHGTVAPTSTSIQTLAGNIDCGGTPSLHIIGGEQVDLGGGVKATLSLQDVSSSGFTLHSVVRAVNAIPGPHKAAALLVVSPQ